jgi:hypothetical protein
MGGGGGTQESKTTTEISPDFKPFITYALGEAKRIYGGMPEAPETLDVGPSAATEKALSMAEERALAGSPLLRAAQDEQLATIQGRGTNPFLAGALEQANRLSGEEFTRNIQNLQSQAASAGRYGSAAMGQQAGVAQDIFARALTEQGGKLAFSSAEAERDRQVEAARNAPAMSAADYADISRLLEVGQGREGYDMRAIEGRLKAQGIPMERLREAANVFYGAPMETTTTSRATPQGGK